MPTLYERVSSRRKVWSPIFPSAQEQATQGAEDTISRCLSLTNLEISVQDFIGQGLSKSDAHKLGEDGKECLLRNAEDEDKHLTALTNCCKVYKDYKLHVDAEGICQAWNAHPDFPITKAAVLENAIFFVILPIYRTYGTLSLRTTSLDISADESIHAMSHRHAAQQFGYKPSKSLDNLRKQTAAWLIETFAVPNVDKELFMRSSDSLMYKGVAPELAAMSQNYTVHSFFEKSSQTLPYYS